MSDYKKCKDCKWLDFTKKTSVGYTCVNPNIYHRGLGYLKAGSAKACVKGFEQRTDSAEWLIRANKTLKDLVFYECSACHFIYCGKLKEYCPNCGAKMKGVYGERREVDE